MQDVFGFNTVVPDNRSGTGGSIPSVQANSEAADSSLLARMRASPALAMMTPERDARYGQKDDTVENIYQQPREAPPPRSGIAQIFNWLTKGELR